MFMIPWCHFQFITITQMDVTRHTKRKSINESQRKNWGGTIPEHKWLLCGENSSMYLR